MFDTLILWIRQVLNKLFDKTDIKKAIGVDVAISESMTNAISLWSKMYVNNLDYMDTENNKTLQLASAISSEFARLITLEMKSTITGSKMADYLNPVYQNFISNIRRPVEYGCALGGIAFKPYVSNGSIYIDVSGADSFIPIEFDGNGNVISGVFYDRYKKRKFYYTRIEYHSLRSGLYTIRNKAYMSVQNGTLGAETSLKDVEHWAGLKDELTIKNVKKPLFGYFKVPLSNTIDTTSPLGVSVYSRAVDLIKQADDMWEGIIWEYNASQLAIDVSASAYLQDKNGNPQIPKGDKRKFRPLETGTNEFLYNVFSPEIRDNALFSGLNNVLKRIEFNVGLAYGTISDPQLIEKTAEEIKTSKQRSYSTVSDMQKSLGNALDDMVYAMSVWASIYGLCVLGKVDINHEWGDGIIIDADKEFANRLMLVQAGILRPEELRAWYTGEDETTAIKNLPEMSQMI